MLTDEKCGLEYHLRKTLVKRAEVFFAVPAEELYVTQGLRTLALDGEAAVSVLDIVGRRYDIV